MRRLFPFSMSLANRITIIRILCVPVFILVFVYYLLSAERAGKTPDGVMHANEFLYWAAMMIFVGAALSDAVDGYFARSRREVTRLGTVLDPLADKALLLSAVILLGRPSALLFRPHLPIWFVLLVVSRDVVLLLGAMLVQHMTGDVKVRPRVSGKITTFLQMLLVVWVFAGLGSPLYCWLLGAATFFTAFSGVQYVIDGIEQIEKV